MYSGESARQSVMIQVPSAMGITFRKTLLTDASHMGPHGLRVYTWVRPRTGTTLELSSGLGQPREGVE